MLIPSIDLGYKEATKANLMTVPPYAVAFVVMFIVSYSSDYYKERGIHITALMSIGTIAYALLATLPESEVHGKYACVCIAVACVYATYPPTHAWAANNFGNETKRAIGMGIYTALGNLGSICSWYLVLPVHRWAAVQERSLYMHGLVNCDSIACTGKQFGA